MASGRKGGGWVGNEKNGKEESQYKMRKEGMVKQKFNLSLFNLPLSKILKKN